MTDKIAKIFLSLLGLCILSALGYSSLESTLEGSNDFVPLYVAAQQLEKGALYDVDAYYDFQKETFGGQNDSLRFTRLPFYALLLRPLAWMSFETANIVFLLVRFAALVGFLWLWRLPSRSDTIVFASWSVPILATLLHGQDTIFLLLLFALAIRWEGKGRGGWAGAALALCSIKYHLFLLVPLAFLARKRWDVLRGFSFSAAVQVALSFLAGGWTWPLDYYRTLTDGRVHPASWVMPNLHGLLDVAPQSLALQLVASLAVVVLAWQASRAAPSLRTALAICVYGGLLTSYHAYMHDTAILFPALLLLFVDIESPVVRAGAVVCLQIPMLLLVSRPSAYFVQATLVLMFFYAASCLLRRTAAPVVEPHPSLTESRA